MFCIQDNDIRFKDVLDCCRMQRRKWIRIKVWQSWISRISIQTAWPQISSAEKSLWRQWKWLNLEKAHQIGKPTMRTMVWKDYSLHYLSTWVHYHKFHNQVSFEIAKFRPSKTCRYDSEIFGSSSFLHHQFLWCNSCQLWQAYPELKGIYAIDKVVVFQYFDIFNLFMGILTLRRFESIT